jgi:hypothetical protein
MDKAETTRPLQADERAAVARLLESAHAALMNDDIPLGRGNIVLGFVTYALERAALDVRRGHRAGDLDTVARDLDRRVHQLVSGNTVT